MSRSCQICQQSYETKQNLDCHILKKHPEYESYLKTITYTIYECKRCSYKSPSKSHFEAHLKTINHKIKETQTVFECYHCGVNFENKKELQQHFAGCSKSSYNEKKSYKCCNKTFKNKGNFDAHIISNHFDDQAKLKFVTHTVYRCTVCNLQSNRFTNYSRHVSNAHPQEKLKKLSKYYTVMDPEPSYQNTSYGSSSNSLAIRQPCHPETTKYECKSCNTLFYQKDDFNRHIFYKHRNEKNLTKYLSRIIYKCLLCESEDFSEIDILHHLDTKHVADILRIEDAM